MQKETVRIKKLRPEAILPSYGSPDAVGADLYALTGAEGLTIAPVRRYGAYRAFHRAAARLCGALCMRAAALPQSAALRPPTRWV